MLILNPDVSGERHEEIVERVRSIITEGGGRIDHMNDWGRRRIAYPIAKHVDGQFFVLTCASTSTALDEVERVLTISKDVVLRSRRIRLTRAQAEFALANGAPTPVDERPEPDARPRGGPRGGGRRRPPR
ncbi:MAG: 30S ribosomal protein S6 [Actinobacteria bacterium]|nr:30S ribosomal protein S6 [Actinomycetota bacterium]